MVTTTTTTSPQPELRLAAGNDGLEELPVYLEQPLHLVLLHVDAILGAHFGDGKGGQVAGVGQLHDGVVEVDHGRGGALLLRLHARVRSARRRDSCRSV